MAILSYLLQWEQAGEKVAHREIQYTHERQKQYASMLVALSNLNGELLSVAEDQHWQLGVHVHSNSTDSEGEAKVHEVVRPKTTAAWAEIANISWPHAALLRKSVFDTVSGTVNVRRGASAQTPSITSSEKGEADILEDMVDHLPPVPDTPIIGSQKVQLGEPIRQTSTPMVGGNVPLNKDVLCRVRAK